MREPIIKNFSYKICTPVVINAFLIIAFYKVSGNKVTAVPI